MRSMGWADWQHLKTTFEEVAEAYDRIRPRYPAELFDDLVEFAELHPGARPGRRPPVRRGRDVHGLALDRPGGPLREAGPPSLCERGALAVVETQHALTEDGDQFFADVQKDYDAVVPSEDNQPRPGRTRSATSPPRWRPAGTSRPRRSVATCGTASTRRTPTSRCSTPTLAIARSTSSTGTASTSASTGIAARPGGTVTKTYLFTLNVARR